MTAETSPRGVRGGAQPPRTRGVPGGRPPGQALLTAAEELFGERSYHRTTVADICARAGMATGNFVGMRWADWTAGGQVPDDVLDDVLELLARGLAPRDPS